MTPLTQKICNLALTFLGVCVAVMISTTATQALTPSTTFAAASCGGQVNGQFDDNVCCPAGKNTTGTECFFGKYLNPIIALLSAAVGIVVVISLIVAGIQYSSAQGDPSKVQAAKQRITNSLIALVAFFFLFAGLNWLIPGGLL